MYHVVQACLVASLCLSWSVIACNPAYAQSETGETAPVELTNYRSGISLKLQGVNGKDYVVERYYHDAPIDDRGTLYIRSSTPIAFEHNALNVYIHSSRAPFKEVGINGPDGKPGSGDEGLIRYKVDRDQLLGITWSKDIGGRNTPRPLITAYEKPLRFDDLEFEPGVKIVGSTGPVPNTPRGPGFYYRGVKDAFGDEWHTITIADDDGAFRDNSRQQASDGKVLLFLVNPKTPCLSLRSTKPDAQYYTSPAKTYFLPYIYQQTTHITDGVQLMLTNITNNLPMFYRIDAGPVQPYNAPLLSDSITDGRHVLEYWIESGPKKIRTIIKNPPYPSASELHPKLLWANDEELNAIKARFQREPYKSFWDKFHNEYTHHDEMDRILGRGSRLWAGSALENALVAYIDGVNSTVRGESRSFASYAKQALLDNKLKLDPVGLELLHHTEPIPTPEWNYFGYWVVNEVYDLSLGYDLLISIYRADQVPGGITPIEDLKIRDSLAHWIVVQLQELRGWESSPDRYRKADPSPSDGMWDTARLSGAAVAAMAMPSYDTSYFGTSGFDNKTQATHPNVPFDSQMLSWKSIFIDADQQVADTPKLRRPFNAFDGGLIKPDGSFHDRMPYYSYPLMGHCFMILANTAKLSCGKSWPMLDKSFERAIDGTLEGHKFTSPSDRGQHRFVQIMLANPRFPTIATKIRDFVTKQQPTTDKGKKNPYYINNLLYEASPLGLLWYQDQPANK